MVEIYSKLKSIEVKESETKTTITKKEETKSVKIKKDKDDEVAETKIKPSFFEEKKRNIIISDSDNFLEFFNKNKDVTINKKLLNNQIDNYKEFLLKNFPNHNLIVQQNKLRLDGEKFKLEDHNIILDNSLDIILERSKDGINFVSNTYDKKLDSSIEFIDLDKAEISYLTPLILDLSNLHKTIGSELFNFFIIPDNIETTLIIHGKKEK